MTWFYFASGSVIFFTALNLLQRKIAVDSDNPRAMAMVFNVIAAFFALGIFFASKAHANFNLPSAPIAWLTLIVASLMYALFERGRFYVAKLLDASVFSTIINVSVAVAFIGSLLLYSETLTTAKLVGVLAIIIALLLVSYSKKKTEISLRGVALGVLICSFLGLGWMLDKLGTVYFKPDTYNIFIWTIPIIFIFFPYIKPRDIFLELKSASWKVFVLAGLNVIGYLLQLKALELHEATRVIPIVQTSTLFTVLLGIVLLKERENMARKLFAGILAIASVYFLVR